MSRKLSIIQGPKFMEKFINYLIDEPSFDDRWDAYQITKNYIKRPINQCLSLPPWSRLMLEFIDYQLIKE